MSLYDAVGSVAFFRERNRVESALTGRVLEALPPDGLSYAPHLQSSTAGVTAWTIVRCLQAGEELVRSSNATLSHGPHPDHATLLAQFYAVSAAMAEGLQDLGQQDWEQERTLTSRGTVILQQPLGQILWLFHVDAIHHRGQLSTYLRPLGAKVPSIYGHSGDAGR